jgi:phosphate transport system substrate-binding protein
MQRSRSLRDQHRRYVPGPRWRPSLIAVLFVLAMPGLAQAQSTPVAGPSITAAGSATLGPVLVAAADAFAAEMPDVTVDVERSSSGAGIERFCAGEVDLGTSGRTMRDEEREACEAAGVQYLEFEVAYDGVAVVTNPENTAVTCVTVDQLNAMWAPGSTVALWSDVDAAWPEQELALYGMGAESGTYQFFTQVMVGEEGSSRDDYNVMEGHPETAEGVASDPNGLGFLPFPRYLDNQDRLSLLEVDGGNGCVAPSPETIQDGSYAPLSRPMYLYVSLQSLERPEVEAYLRHWFGDAANVTSAGGLVPSGDDVYADNLERLEGAIAGGGTPKASPAA